MCEGEPPLPWRGRGGLTGFLVTVCEGGGVVGVQRDRGGMVGVQRGRDGGCAEGRGDYSIRHARGRGEGRLVSAYYLVGQT